MKKAIALIMSFGFLFIIIIFLINDCSYSTAKPNNCSIKVHVVYKSNGSSVLNCSLKYNGACYNTGNNGYVIISLPDNHLYSYCAGKDDMSSIGYDDVGYCYNGQWDSYIVLATYMGECVPCPGDSPGHH